MCKSFIEVKNGKVLKLTGYLKKGHWVFCKSCGFISLNKKMVKITCLVTGGETTTYSTKKAKKSRTNPKKMV
jgi:hypothetical protein